MSSDNRTLGEVVGYADLELSEIELEEITLQEPTNGRLDIEFRIPAGSPFFVRQIGVSDNTVQFSCKATLIVSNKPMASVSVCTLSANDDDLFWFTESDLPDWKPRKPIKAPSLSVFSVRLDCEPPVKAVAKLRGFYVPLRRS